MTLSSTDLAKFIDHTLLKPEATREQITRLCEEALQHQFYAVCVNSSFVPLCKEILKDSPVKIASVVGFPLGACDTNTKVFETQKALHAGAHEIDMVIHIGALKASDYTYVEKEIKDLVLVAQGAPIKVIFETHLLTQEEIVRACELSVSAGAHYVKTSTGFTGGGATLQDVALMKSIVKNKAQVKASGGVRDYETALKMIEAGATRIGTSSGVAIVNKAVGKSSY